LFFVRPSDHQILKILGRPKTTVAHQTPYSHGRIARSRQAEALNPTALSESATTPPVLWTSWQPTSIHLLAWERLAVFNTERSNFGPHLVAWEHLAVFNTERSNFGQLFNMARCGPYMASLEV
jgi:hypothetical protein